MDTARSSLIDILKSYNLNLDVPSKLKTVHFLAVTFDLNIGTWRPFRKPNNQPLLIRTIWDCPSNITKHIYKSKIHWLATNSDNRNIFNEVKKKLLTSTQKYDTLHLTEWHSEQQQ